VIPLTVVLTGSECTGKSTLAAKLAERFGAPLSAEFSREYAERKESVLDETDVEPIAAGQLERETAADRQATERGALVVVRDTDLFSTVVYSRHYYGLCPEWVEDAALRRAGGLYLLLRPDVPWVPDGVRDRPDDAARTGIHASFASVLARAGVRVVEIGGDWPSREAAAVAAISEAMYTSAPWPPLLKTSTSD
jgi:NadR type nicotinamide-nucleotide adenylyltransferase